MHWYVAADLPAEFPGGKPHGFFSREAAVTTAIRIAHRNPGSKVTLLDGSMTGQLYFLREPGLRDVECHSI